MRLRLERPEMIGWLEGGGVYGDGFTIKTGFNFAVYREGTLTITIDVGRGFKDNRHVVIIPEDAFSRWDDSRELNVLDEQVRIRANFIKGMEFSGHLVAIIPYKASCDPRPS